MQNEAAKVAKAIELAGAGTTDAERYAKAALAALRDGDKVGDLLQVKKIDRDYILDSL